MIWKCSFQRVYRRVFVSADSKGVSELRVVTAAIRTDLRYLMPASVERAEF
jgi:hypothetical protein